MGERPVRLRLSRQKGFDLQALSLATNGLPAMSVARPGPLGNPFSIQDAAGVFETNREASHRHAVAWFRDWITTPISAEAFEPMCAWDGTQAQHRFIHSQINELRGKNLACFCRADFACHADVLLELANDAATPDRENTGAPSCASFTTNPALQAEKG